MRVFNSVLAKSTIIPTPDVDQSVMEKLGREVLKVETIGRQIVYKPYEVNGILYDDRIILSKSIFTSNSRVAYTIVITKDDSLIFKFSQTDEDYLCNYKAVHEFYNTVNSIFGELSETETSVLQLDLVAMLNTDSYVFDHSVFQTKDGKGYSLYIAIEDKIIQKSSDLPIKDKRIMFGIFRTADQIIALNTASLMSAIHSLAVAGFTADITIFEPAAT